MNTQGFVFMVVLMAVAWVAVSHFESPTTTASPEPLRGSPSQPETASWRYKNIAEMSTTEYTEYSNWWYALNYPEEREGRELQQRWNGLSKVPYCYWPTKAQQAVSRREYWGEIPETPEKRVGKSGPTPNWVRDLYGNYKPQKKMTWDRALKRLWTGDRRL